MSSTLKKETLTLQGYGQKPILADLTYPAARPRQLIVYAHGINGFKDWGGMNLVADQFADSGIVFLKFNFSHNGTTPKTPEQFTDLEAYAADNYSIRHQELKEVIDFATSYTPLRHVEQITLIGHSRGGTDAILYAPTDGRVDNLVSWAAPCEAKTPWQHWDSEQMQHWKDKGVIYRENGRTGQQMPIGYQLYENYQQNHKKWNVEKAARKISIPWLIAHGNDDEAVFVKNAYDLKEWQPKARVLIIENTGHTFGRSHPWNKPILPADTQRLIAGCLEFI